MRVGWRDVLKEGHTEEQELGRGCGVAIGILYSLFNLTLHFNLLYKLHLTF